MLEDLRRLLQQAGGPSLSQLKDHADLDGHEISRAALWDLLNGKGRPRLSTVEAFVAACARFARCHRPPIKLPPEAIDPAAWRARYQAAYPQPPARRRSTARHSIADHRIIVPRQLPVAIPRLAGRRAELDELHRLLKDSSTTSTDGTAAIFVITGTAGVGKTSLAVWWARQVADEFPDGHLYVNLRGFDDDAPPATPDEALRGFLDAFGIPPSRIPAGVPAQSALYRSLLAGRRVIVVLDNARDAGQVRPLLPGAPGCVALVTGRTDLTSLVAIEGARLQTLDLLSEPEAEQLLRDRIGESRMAAEPEAVDRIIESCARLPLALAIVAARAMARPRLFLSAVAEELRAFGGLDALTVGRDVAADVRAVLSWSYRALDVEAARLFRLLGLHPGPDIDVTAAASLAGVTVDRVLPLLSELAGAYLISERTPNRYDLHDLLRRYASELVRADHHANTRSAAQRVINHYLDMTHAADQLLDPHRDRRTCLVEPEPSPNADYPTDVTWAWAWLRAEHRVLVATVDLALRTGTDAHAWQLAWTLSTFLDRDGHWHDWVATMTAALDAAERLGHRAGQAVAHRALAHGLFQQGHLDDAIAHLQHSLRLFHELGDTLSEAATHNTIGGVRDQQGHREEALDHAQQALHLFAVADDQIGLAHAHNSVGWCHAQLGRHDLAIASCERSRLLLEDLGDQYGQAVAWDSIGFIRHEMGDHSQAVGCYEHALALFRNAEDRYYESAVLVHLGDCHHDLGHAEQARAAWTQAMIILDDLDHADADSVRDKLLSLDPPP